MKDDHPSGLSGVAASIASLTGAAAASAVRNAFVDAVKQDARVYHLGYRLPLGVHKLYVACSVLDDRRAASADTASFGAAFTDTLSMRTNLNVVLTRFDNKNLAQTAPGQAGSPGGVTASAGTDSTALAIGLRHSFWMPQRRGRCVAPRQSGVKRVQRRPGLKPRNAHTSGRCACS